MEIMQNPADKIRKTRKLGLLSTSKRGSYEVALGCGKRTVILNNGDKGC